MKSAKEEEFELFSLFISCSVPTLEIIRRKQKTVRYKWSIMNIEILEKNPKIVLTNSKCQHPFSKRFLARAKTKTYLGKRDTLPFLTLPCEILITCVSVELRLFFYFTGNGIQHLKSNWKYVTFNPIRCFSFLRQGVSRLQNRVVTRTGTSDELSQFIENSNWRASPKCLSLKSFAKPHEIPRFGWVKQLRASVEISLAIVRVLNDISSQLNWGTSDSRKGCVLQNAMRNVFECLI